MDPVGLQSPKEVDKILPGVAERWKRSLQYSKHLKANHLHCPKPKAPPSPNQTCSPPFVLPGDGRGIPSPASTLTTSWWLQRLDGLEGALSAELRPGGDRSGCCCCCLFFWFVFGSMGASLVVDVFFLMRWSWEGHVRETCKNGMLKDSKERKLTADLKRVFSSTLVIRSYTKPQLLALLQQINVQFYVYRIGLSDFIDIQEVVGLCWLYIVKHIKVSREKARRQIYIRMSSFWFLHVLPSLRMRRSSCPLSSSSKRCV